MRFKKPIIGITSSAVEAVNKPRWPSRYDFDFMKRAYSKSVIDAGGIPVPLANIPERSVIADYVGMIDGLILTGGDDMNPRHFGQKPHPSIVLTAPERDEFELGIVKMAKSKKKPILGICRGLQVINIALGGTIYQDLTCAPFKTINHADPKERGGIFHKANIEDGSNLLKIVKSPILDVNSSHHQIIEKLGRHLKAVAFSEDGVIEAIESSEPGFLLAVQWHPEKISRRLHTKKLFKAFVTACAQK